MTFSLEKLKSKFAVLPVRELGDCVVIPSDEFDLAWEFEFTELGIYWEKTTLDGSPFVLVQVDRDCKSSNWKGRRQVVFLMMAEKLYTLAKDATVIAANASSHILKLVYVRYKDHVYFKNYRNPPSKAMKRETVGWVKEENAELMLIVCDKAVSTSEGQVNGLIILKSCILEMIELPLHRFSDEDLNSLGAKEKE